VLSDRDRASWQEIQAQFVSDDPSFARTFDTDLPPPPGPGPDPRGPAAPSTPIERQRRPRVVLMWIAAVLCMSLPAMAGPTGGLLLLGIAAVAALVMARHTGGGTGKSGPEA